MSDQRPRRILNWVLVLIIGCAIAMGLGHLLGMVIPSTGLIAGLVLSGLWGVTAVRYAVVMGVFKSTVRGDDAFPR